LRNFVTGLLFFATFALGFGHLFQSFHLFELLKRGTFVDTLLVVQTDLSIGLSEVEKAGFALNESYYKVPIFHFIFVSKRNVDFS
jgi:hypothetical protein